MSAGAAEFEIRRGQDGAYLQQPLEDAPKRLRPEEVLLRPRLVGICGSDLAAHSEGRNLGCCFGHEWLGEVVAVGSAVQGLAVGDRATSSAFIGCGRCHACVGGHSNHCESPLILGNHELGAARSWLRLPEHELVRVPDSMGDAGLLLEPASVGIAILRALERLEADASRVLVVGAGPIGLLTALLLQESGAEVTMVDTNESRLAGGREIGAQTVDGRDPERLESLERSFPAAIDCAHGRDGGRGGWEYVPRLVRRGGAVVAVAKYPAQAELGVEALASSGLTVAWLRGAPRSCVAEAASRWAGLLEDRHRWLVSDEFAVGSIQHAIHRALDAEKSRKVALRLD